MGVADGAAKGAAMGSVVPGIGTVAGGVVGGIAGIFDDDEEEAAGGPDVLAPAPLDGQQYGDQYWGGQGYAYDQGKLIPGTSGADQDVNRARAMGDAAMGRQAPSLQYGAAYGSLHSGHNTLGQGANALNQVQYDRDNAEQARRAQVGGLQLQHSAALGQQPSRAEILGRGLIGQSLRSQMAGASAARGGPLAQMAARRQVQQGAAGFQQQGTNQLSALRADEMERARAGLVNSANSLRGSDYQGAANAVQWGQGYQGLANQYGTNAQTFAQMEQERGRQDLAQRQMNDARSNNMERLAFDTRSTAFTGNQADARLRMEQQAQRDKQAAEQRGQDMQLAGAVTGAVGAAAGAAMKSDMRAKNPAPLLLDMAGRKPSAASPNWLDKFMSPERAEREKVHAQDEHDDRLEQLDAPNIYRDDPYAGPTPGGIQRQDPYAENPDEGEFFFSDERAKKEAFQQGVLYGNAVRKPGDEDKYRELLPSYWNADNQPTTQGAIGTGQPRAPEPRQPNTAASSRKGLVVDRAPSAGAKDMEHRGVPVPREQRTNIGDREVERGRPADIPVPAPKRMPGTGAEISALQQDANRRGAGFPYTYKGQYTPPDQKPGQLNYGPSANELEQNPLTATAVSRDPRDGMRQVSVPMLVKNNTAGIASLQEQIDQLRGRHG
jgi:hypothetical protein